MAVHTELIRRLADDFTALEEAVLRQVNGVGAPETAAALEDPALVGPVTVVLAHADVLARGAVRRAELAVQPPERLRRLRAQARTVRRARSQAEARYKKERARRIGRPRPVEPLELRVVRTAFPSSFHELLRQELRGAGLPDGSPHAPESDLARWAWERATDGRDMPAAVRELLDRDDEAFVQALLLDAREEENPLLPHDAVVERWSRHTRTASAWGRYAIGQAERDVLACPPTARRAQLDALGDAYQDAAVLAARSREAQLRATDLHDRMQACVASAPFAEVVAQCRAGALARFKHSQPEAWRRVRDLTVQHQADCPERSDGCRRCHGTVAEILADEPLAGQQEDGEREPSVPPSSAHDDRYALLADLPETAVVAVADAALGEDAAVCGYGWASEEGSTGHGDSMAASSGEAEVIGICAAALSLLERHQGVPVVLLCDSTEAVDAVDSALRAADPGAAHRTLLFPESRQLLDRLVRHRDRVQVRWLKGHVGHDLNETADAYARLALRRATGHVSAAMARKEAARILRTFGSVQHHSPAAA
ncbi:RNase H family protein [Streptomyces sp. NPDC059805]|uniref:RNase H family protein n=1 Tax=Streptomyces sp. NPDC059805 TaxID=3346954 RepID=UPI00364B4E08